MSRESVERTYLYALAFVCGACVMTVEMAGQRALTPHFGSSTYVWTNVIGVILAALSVGYMAGGRLADRLPKPTILLSIVGAAGLLSLLVPVLAHALGDAVIPEGMRQESAFRVVYLGSFLLTLLLFAPPVLLLGMVSPFIIRLVTRDKEEAGRSSGTVYAFSTVGSILGTFLPTLLLIPSIGTSATIYSAAAGLLVFAALGGALFAPGRKKAVAALWLVPLLPALAALSVPIKADASTLEETESAYHYIRVHDRKGALALSLNEELETFHSIWKPGHALTDTHFDALLLLPLHFDPALRPRLRVYIAGLAAGVTSRQVHHFYGRLFHLEIDGAEIDPEILSLGRRYFGLQGPDNRNLHAFTADGRLFLDRSRGTYDLILVDAYADQMYVPFQMASREFFLRVRDRLAPGGLVGMNVADLGPDGRMLAAVRNTLATVFGAVEQIKIPGTMNYLLYAGRDGVVDAGAIPENVDRPALLSRPEAERLVRVLRAAFASRKRFHADPARRVLTDDLAPVARLADASFREARREMGDIAW